MATLMQRHTQAPAPLGIAILCVEIQACLVDRDDSTRVQSAVVQSAVVGTEVMSSCQNAVCVRCTLGFGFDLCCVPCVVGSLVCFAYLHSARESSHASSHRVLHSGSSTRHSPWTMRESATAARSHAPQRNQTRCFGANQSDSRRQQCAQHTCRQSRHGYGSRGRAAAVSSLHGLVRVVSQQADIRSDKQG
jgi:hypothetical protein